MHKATLRKVGCPVKDWLSEKYSRIVRVCRFLVKVIEHLKLVISNQKSPYASEKIKKNASKLFYSKWLNYWDRIGPRLKWKDC